MKSTLRSKIAAAAMLLVPVGAMLAVTPASAQHRDGYSDRGHGYGYDRDQFRRDRQAPRIFDVTPDNGDVVSERGRTRIAARFHDRESGVGTVVLRVDGRDVTGHARVDGDDIRYAENLRPGRHVAELVVRDRAGNTSRRTWTFDVANDVRNHGYGYGRDGVYGQPQRW
jgi:hypothetical protein